MCCLLKKLRIRGAITALTTVYRENEKQGSDIKLAFSGF